MKLIIKIFIFHLLDVGRTWLSTTRKLNVGGTDRNESFGERQKLDDNDRLLKESILEAALQHVPIHGWTRTAIGRGAEAVGFTNVTHGLFPKGGIELVQYFYVSCNQNLVKKMEKITSESPHANDPSEFVQNAVKARLIMIKPYLPQWPQAIAMMSLPPNVPTSLAQLLTLVDDICYYAGDRSVDWYSRRVALAGIFKMTELYMIQDTSNDHEKTWKFLSRRIKDAAQVSSALEKSGDVTQNATEAISAAFVTARNILGLNWHR